MARRRITNDSRLRRKLRRFPEGLRTEIAAEMKAGSDELLQALKDRAPKEEGDLAAAALARVSRDGLSAQVGYSQTKSGFKRAWKRGGFTALFQEFGTAHHPAQPFIRPAYRSQLKSILGRIDAAVDRALKRASTGDY